MIHFLVIIKIVSIKLSKFLKHHIIYKPYCSIAPTISIMDLISQLNLKVLPTWSRLPLNDRHGSYRYAIVILLEFKFSVKITCNVPTIFSIHINIHANMYAYINLNIISAINTLRNKSAYFIISNG